MAAFLSGLIALKDLSPADKVYWKTMFDYYIFQTSGDPVAHIPPEVQADWANQRRRPAPK
ncbi:MAG: hypothetical protein WDN06_13545 [Asticcacaulis sp.]